VLVAPKGEKIHQRLAGQIAWRAYGASEKA